MTLSRAIVVSLGLASLTSAAPSQPDVKLVNEPLFVPAAEVKFHVEAVNLRQPQHIEYSAEEFAAWTSAVNVTGGAPPSHSAPITAHEAAQLAGRDTIGNGPDDRTLVTSTSYPWTAIGKTFASVPGGYIVCSGTLIGPRLVATARHCIVSDAAWTKFSPRYDNGDTQDTAMVTHIISRTKNGDDICETKNDWAIYVLDKPLGNQYGYFGAASFEADDAKVGNQHFMFNAGYPGDRDGGNRMYQQSGRAGALMYHTVWASCSNIGPVSTDCDVAGGQSGGPLWRLLDDQRWQYGVLSVAMYINGVLRDSSFAQGNDWVNAIGAARQTYPA